MELVGRKPWVWQGQNPSTASDSSAILPSELRSVWGDLRSGRRDEMPVGHQQTQKISCSPVSGVEPWLRGIVRSAHPKHGDILPVLDLITAQSTAHCHTGFLKVLMKESILPQSSSPCAGPRQCLGHMEWCTRAGSQLLP